MRDLIGQQLGNYRLIRSLGSGGFAAVYLGQHVRLSTQTAIKVLHTHFNEIGTLSDEEIKRFEQEAETIAKLVHPHIVRILDFDVTNGIPFIVMDYCPNGTLRQRYPKGALVPLLIVVTYIRQVADALQYAHDRKIIHRDIKPENMLIGHNGDLLLSDFGVAVTVHRTSTMSNTQMPVGTIPYMAPEQIHGQARPASDQYALGIVVYGWLCGVYPFEGSFIEICAKHLTTPPPSLLEKVPTLPPEVEQVVFKALAKDPHQRFASVLEFAQALEQAARSTTYFTKDLISTPSADRPRSTSEAVYPDSLASPNSITNLSLWTTPSAKEDITRIANHDLPTNSSEPADQATLRIHPAVPTPARLPNAVSPLASPPQTPVMFQLFYALRHKLTRLPHRMHTVVTSSPTIVKGLPLGTLISTYRSHSDKVRAVTWSPDGNYLATTGNDGTIQIWDPSTSRRVSLYRGHTATVHTISWASGGTHLVTASADKTVALWVSSTGQKAFTYRGHPSEVYAAVWSPDAQRLVSAGADRIARLWNAVTHKDLVLYKGHEDWIRAIAWSPDGKNVATASNDMTVHIWDAATGHLHLIYNHHTDWVRSISWSPDGLLIATGSNDQTVHIWEAATGHQRFIYQGHTAYWLGSVLSVSWSPDGKYVASAGEDQTVQIWEALTGNQVFTYRCHSAPVNAIAWSPDGSSIATASNDKTVHVWSCSNC